MSTSDLIIIILDLLILLVITIELFVMVDDVYGWKTVKKLSKRQLRRNFRWFHKLSAHYIRRTK